MKYFGSVPGTRISFALSVLLNIDFISKTKHFLRVFSKSILFVKLKLNFNLQSTFLFLFFSSIDSVSVTDLLVLFAQYIYYSPSYPKTALTMQTGKYLFLIYAKVYIIIMR